MSETPIRWMRPLEAAGARPEAARGADPARRDFLKYAGFLASLMATLPPERAAAMVEALSGSRRQSVIWLSFQECTGCTESLTRSHDPSLEELIFDLISLDYHHTLQAASGEAAEAARRQAMAQNEGRYVVVVDGSVPMAAGGIYSTIAGRTNADLLAETVQHAAAVIAVGTCAAYGGLPAAQPNPTGAVAISELIGDKPLVNIPGCPPIPHAMAGTLAYFLAFGRLPELDEQHRPRAFFGETIHDRCYRRPFYERGLFAHSFDDEGARRGWCLYELGCKGPVTYNHCATAKWNGGVSFPIQSGHGCLGCSEAGFWDRGSLYAPLPTSTASVGAVAAGAAAAGAVIGAGAALLSRYRRPADAPASAPSAPDDRKDP